jgi:hypothetical protein
MRRVFVVAMVLFASVPSASAQAPRAVTDHDKTEIQALVTRYATALGTCAAEEFADLFAPTSGYFASGFRGQVVGRDRLIALVRSERHCIAAPATPPAARPGPTVVVNTTASGVFGVADLGAAGRYEDEYVKTPRGWRFATRHVLTPGEMKAGLTARDMIEIATLAGASDFGDILAAGPDGVKRLRSSGVAIGVSPNGITGRALLKDGSGYYDDVYANTPEGRWRFVSRTFVAESQAVATPVAQARPLSLLTALDYFEIGQLVAKYARYIDTCSNNGYDYADLFAVDGFFQPAVNGKPLNRFQGREALAEVSGGGKRGCKNVGWIEQGVKHMYVNHIINPSPDGGATGTVDMLMIGLDKDPYRIRHEGHYDDTYVKTPQGWRFKSRVHFVPEGGTISK